MNTINFKKKDISVEQQVRINDEIADLVNGGKEDAVIIYHLHDRHDFTFEEARSELKKAKMFMNWYSIKDSKEHAK